MTNYPLLDDVDLNDVQKDLNRLMYMLHYLDDEAFTKEEIRGACFSLVVMQNTIEKMLLEKKTGRE